jgi:hypothetical protein
MNPADKSTSSPLAQQSVPNVNLPYVDTKPQGAPDFYFAINATFRFILTRLGPAEWVRYLGDLGQTYFEPVNARWRKDGLPAVAGYWRAFFAAETGAEVDVVEHADRVELHVRRCPAIAHLREGKREIVREFCWHCYHLGEARATAGGGMTIRIAGGNGACRQTIFASSVGVPPQDLSAIKEAL